MGSSCSSRGHKDKDSISSKSEDSVSYQLSTEKRTTKSNVQRRNHSVSHSGIILVPSTQGGSANRRPGSNSTTENAVDSMSLSSPPGTSVQSPKDFDKLSTEMPLPTEIQHLSENMQNVFLGRIGAAKTIYKTRKIVLYVCAADSQDCSVEKSILHNIVYPELREHCREQGYELHIVDLHWKTSLEKQRNHEFPQLCIGELARHMEAAYVIPVIFLNNTLGTPLLPNAIEHQDFEMTVRDAENKESLQKWYIFDNNSQPPCYRLQPSSVHIPGFKVLRKNDVRAIYRHIYRFSYRYNLDTTTDTAITCTDRITNTSRGTPDTATEKTIESL